MGFSMGCDPKNLISAIKNLPSAFKNPEVIDGYLQNEISLLSIVGPFESPPFPNLHINRFGVIPKSTPGKRSLITDLSFPHGNSVNDGTAEELCHTRCPSIKSAVKKIIKYGKGALMAKFDLSRAYCNIPICEQDRKLLGMRWKNKYYVDLALPSGGSSVPNIFNRAADLLCWIYSDASSYIDQEDIQHFYDDFIVIGPPNSDRCQKGLENCFRISTDLGVGIEMGKTVFATTRLLYLGYILDSNLMQTSLPEDKLLKGKELLKPWFKGQCKTKRKLLSLIGFL